MHIPIYVGYNDQRTSHSLPEDVEELGMLDLHLHLLLRRTVAVADHANHAAKFHPNLEE